jgi:hypothetical protein
MANYLPRLVWVCLPVRADTSGNLTEDLLQPYLVTRKPLHVVEGLYVNKIVWRESRECVKSVVPGVREVRSDGSGDFVALEKVHHLVTFPLEVRIHLPNGSETVEMLWVMLAQEADDEVHAVCRLLFLDLLREPRK